MRDWKYVAPGAERVLLEEPRVGHHVELELVDSARNAQRFYRMAITDDPQLPLFGEPGPPVLVVARGRLGKAALVRRERHPSLEAVRARWRVLLEARRRHGYALVASSLGV